MNRPSTMIELYTATYNSRGFCHTHHAPHAIVHHLYHYHTWNHPLIILAIIKTWWSSSPPPPLSSGASEHGFLIIRQNQQDEACLLRWNLIHHDHSHHHEFKAHTWCMHHTSCMHMHDPKRTYCHSQNKMKISNIPTCISNRLNHIKAVWWFQFIL